MSVVLVSPRRTSVPSYLHHCSLTTVVTQDATQDRAEVTASGDTGDEGVAPSSTQALPSHVNS